MTVYQHAAHTFILMKLTGASTFASIGTALFAMLPDILPRYQTRKGNWDGLYREIHHPVQRSPWGTTATFIWLTVVVCGLLYPPLLFAWYLHLTVDYLTHDQVMGGWKDWAWAAEFVLDITGAAYILAYTIVSLWG